VEPTICCGFKNYRCKGEAWMKLGENLTREQVLEKPDKHIINLIVDICSDLIAEWAFTGVIGLVSDHVPGIISLAVGTGAGGWDIQNPPEETPDLELLYSELARKHFSNKTYIDPTYNPTTSRTNMVDFTTMFDYSEANGPLVEMGLFGGNDALLPNSGTRVNAKHFSVLNKTSISQLTILYRLIF
jgi:hypothetical protein